MTESKMEKFKYGDQFVYYPVRRSLIPQIKSDRKAFFRNVVGSNKDDKDFELADSEFLIISVLYQSNLNNLVIYFTLVTAYGSVFIAIFYFLFQMCIGMPLHCLLTFMSSYAKKSFLRFFECVPIFQGVGYTFAILRFATDMHNVMLASLALVCISHVVRENHFEHLSKCSKLANSTQGCLPMYPETNNTKVCTGGKNFQIDYISTQFYFRKHILKFEEANYVCCTLNVRMLIASICVWIVIFCFCIFGLDRIRRLTMKLQLIFGLTLVIVAIYAVVVDSEDIGDMMSPVQFIVDRFDFWIDMIVNAAGINLLGNIIHLGKLKPETLTPKQAALVVCLFQTVLFISLICISSRIRYQLIKHYKFTDYSCLVVNGHDLLFTLIPDVLYRTPFGILFIVCWYTGIFVFAVLTPIYTIIAIVDSITEQFKKLNRYRLFVYLTLCVLGAILHSALCTNISLGLVYSFQKFGVSFMMTTLLLLVSIALVFVYTIKRISDDYSFTMGVAPNEYWIITWRTTPIFSLFAFMFTLYHISTIEDERPIIKTMAIVSYIVSAVMLLPIFIVFLTKCCKHVKYRTLSSLSKPSEHWGPYNPIRKQARKHFYPHRDVKYRNNVLNCAHKCMSSSAKFYDEKRVQSQKLQGLITNVLHKKLNED